MKKKPGILVLLACIACTASFAQRKIILKLDDLKAPNYTCNSIATLDYLVQKQIKAGFGAIANGFDSTSLNTLTPYLFARNSSGEKLFEIWNHGLDHVAPEFQGTSYAYQKAHFDSATNLIKKYLKVQMRSFGAPFNASDTNTNKAIAADTNYKVTMFNNNNFAAAAADTNLKNRVDMETTAGHPSYSFFLGNYNANKNTYAGLMVLQGHPLLWGSAEQNEFAQVVDFLISEGCEFVLPYEYYRSKRPFTTMQAQTISFDPMPAKAVGFGDFYPGAAASSDLLVSYTSSNLAVATIVNGKIHIVGAGTATITASQSGNAWHYAAAPVSQTLTVNQSYTVPTGDYRTIDRGNWSNTAIWQVRNGSGNWVNVLSPPASTNNVYIQAGHVVVVDIPNAFCKDLQLNAAGVLTVGADTLNIYGKMRAWTMANVTNVASSGTVATITTTAAHGLTTGQTVVMYNVLSSPATFNGTAIITSVPSSTTFTYVPFNATVVAAINTAGSVSRLAVKTAADDNFYSSQVNVATIPAGIISAVNGALKFAGAGRAIFNAGEWSNNIAVNALVNFALDANATGTIATQLKLNAVVISSGIISASNAIYLSTSYTAGQGDFTIKNGARFISARSGGSTISNSGGKSCGTVTLEAGGALELTGATPFMDCTAFINNGSIIYSGAAQTLLQPNAGVGIPINTYKNLIIRGSGIKTIPVGTPVTVSGSLQIMNGSLTTGANNLTIGGTATLSPATSLLISGGVTDFAGNLVILQSSAAGTATIGAIAGTLNNATNVTVQQYIPAGFRRYRFLSHPFSTAQPLTQLTDNIDITGSNGSTNGFTTTQTNNPSAYYFTTANADTNTTNDAGWTTFANTTGNNWAPGQGIRVLVRGTKGQTGSLDGSTYTPEAVTLDMNGPINIGTVNISLSTAGTGFNLVGNPYPSPVNIGAVLTAAAGSLANKFYVRNPQTGIYTPISITPNYMLPANSAFFVKAIAATTLHFTETNKGVCTSCPTVFRTTASKDYIQLKAFKNNLEYDNLEVYWTDSNTSSYEPVADAVKINNEELSLYTLSSDKIRLASDYRGQATMGRISIGILLPAAVGKQTYQLKLSDYEISSGARLVLHDKWKNSYTDLRPNTAYTLEIDPANAASIGENRLAILITK